MAWKFSRYEPSREYLVRYKEKIKEISQIRKSDRKTHLNLAP